MAVQDGWQARTDPALVRRVALVGAGVIGGGWALHYLRMGLDVGVYDPDPGARAALLGMLDETWPLLERLGLRGGASVDRLSFHADLAGAVAGADVVQESSPEDGPLKRGVLTAVDAVAPAGVVIASSTSGFLMSMLQAECVHPGRCVVGHPFNPPYLIPLVEVVGGAKTDLAAVSWLTDFYTAVGKRPLQLTRELPGFVGNRLQEAMWREALHMVAAGEATVEEIDESIAFGPGLRWAQMGPCLTFHLAGGNGGMAHMLDHFGAALLEPWTRLQAPPLTAQLREQMVAGCLREAAGRPVAELARRRDEFLAGLLGLVQRFPIGKAAGTASLPCARAADGGRPGLTEPPDPGSGRPALTEPPDPGSGRPGLTEPPDPGSGAAASAAVPWPPDRAVPAPLRLHQTTVRGAWVDYNNHLSEWAFLLIFGDSSDAFFRFFGVDEAYRASGRSLYTVETHMRNLSEVRLGAGLQLTVQVLGVDSKRLHIVHEMYNGDCLAATAEQMLLHVDTQAGGVTPFPGEIGRRLRMIEAVHAALPVPGYVGQVMRIPGR